MLTKFQYNPTAFEQLNHFDVAKSLLETNSHHIDELGDVICQYGLEDVVGLCLLHKHFELNPDECMVKEMAQSAAYIRPFSINYVQSLIPCAWRLGFNTESGQCVVYPLEFVPYSEKAELAYNLAHSINNASGFLLDFSRKLEEMGLTDVFGIFSLHSDIEINDNEILLETTNLRNRILSLVVTSKDEVDWKEITETTWKFTAIKEELDELDPLGICIAHCRRHCGSHCRGHCPIPC
ncbi:MAG TPA: hypothetical protein DDW76_26180 [Cyanobacteria bacterium UBA11369]|nr:hypothetical protein [Cyanobacteria bacterium UBA11371]HBE18404.1 hypothetical protein [Cyanobacteria bacterium UBA11367]HBE31110.1 hypothetical protein [Cyanobacteria bacterium UBA11368]HBE52161.1 hypothetical protein [Cyanobacteria bacterium UBA11369]